MKTSRPEKTDARAVLAQLTKAELIDLVLSEYPFLCSGHFVLRVRHTVENRKLKNIRFRIDEAEAEHKRHWEEGNFGEARKAWEKVTRLWDAEMALHRQYL